MLVYRSVDDEVQVLLGRGGLPLIWILMISMEFLFASGEQVRLKLGVFLICFRKVSWREFLKNRLPETNISPQKRDGGRGLFSGANC